MSASKVREVIDCCCESDANARPTMQEVVRILEGESWAQILEARGRSEDFVKLLGVIGPAALLIRALANKQINCCYISVVHSPLSS